ncbi:MAG: rod shape-determining protein MreD [Clostridiales Family XIII bacterium]|nr:rod shape-determining protein MreD [Clostridiales Family XIII bacterium]
MKKYIAISITILLCFFFQLIIARIFLPDLTFPNLAFCLVIIITFFFGYYFALIYGVVIGFFLDIIANNIFGISSIFFMILIGAIFLLKKTFNKNNIFIITLISIISFTIYIAINTSLFILVSGPITIINIIREFGIEILENTIVIILLYFIFKEKQVAKKMNFERIKYGF